MALNDKQTPFGFDIEERIKNTRTANTHNHTHTPTHDYTQETAEDVVRERKTRRIQVLTYDSLVDRMDACAKKQGLSRAELIEKVMSDYLDTKGV